MNKRPIDRTKKSNIKCEHCKYWDKTKEVSIPCSEYSFISKVGYMCLKQGEIKNYYNRCKQFEWEEE